MTDSSLAYKIQYFIVTVAPVNPELTVHQHEVVQEQQQVLKGTTTSDLDKLQRGYHRTLSYDTRQPKKQNPRHLNRDNWKAKPCLHCGKGQQPWEKCPARDAVCHHCQKKEPAI